MSHTSTSDKSFKRFITVKSTSIILCCLVIVLLLSVNVINTEVNQQLRRIEQVTEHRFHEASAPLNLLTTSLDALAVQINSNFDYSVNEEHSTTLLLDPHFIKKQNQDFALIDINFVKASISGSVDLKNSSLVNELNAVLKSLDNFETTLENHPYITAVYFTSTRNVQVSVPFKNELFDPNIYSTTRWQNILEQKKMLLSEVHPSNNTNNNKTVMTFSAPLIFENQLYGVLSFDFSPEIFNEFLNYSDIPALTSIYYQNNLIAQSDFQFTSPFLNVWENEFIRHNFGYNLSLLTTINYAELIAIALKDRLYEIIALFMCLALIISFIVIYQLYKEQKSISIIDPLTTLLNRRGFYQSLLKLSKPSKYGIAIVDIDHFKRINDTYGHDVGDEVLRFIGLELKTLMIKPLDMVARFGGEEFLFFFEAQDLDEVLIRLERFRQHMQDSICSSKNIAFTVSIGVAWNNKDSIPTDTEIDTLAKYADEALYYVKSNGRNNIKVADSNNR